VRDNYLDVFPDNVVIKVGGSSDQFDYNFCMGCGICVKECPCGAIDMVPERN
jgi:Pyruvate/2-oxoacid:ferredoxin oxidoreductase delta subunit